MSLLHLAVSYLNMVHNNIGLVLSVTRHYKNYFHVLLNVLLKRYPVTAISKKGERNFFNSFGEFYNNLLGLRFDSEKDIVYLGKLVFHGGLNHGDNIASIFKRKEYSFLEVKGTTVIDIGAGIGDSSIYFVQSGASKVISVEANRMTYDYAQENIRVNNVGDRVNLIWAACIVRGSQNLENVPQISLDQLISGIPQGPIVLKIDCEGCEYDILESLPASVLRRLNRIQIEYHYGYKNLKRKLESCGFNVAITTPRYFRPTNVTTAGFDFYDRVERLSKIMFVGWIYAKK